MHQTLEHGEPEFSCAWSLMPWRIGGPAKWTPQMRSKQASLLRATLALERQAISKIEELLPMMQPTDA
jgi:hypothetical protein